MIKLNLFFFVLLFVANVNSVVCAKSTSVFKFPSFFNVHKIGGGELDVNGYKFASFSFQSSKENKQIRAFYQKLWEGKIRTVETPDWIYHTNFNGKYLTSVQVRNAKENGMGSYGGSPIKASGLISISEPGAIKGLSSKPKVELFYPMTPGTKKLSDLSTIDMGKKSRTTVYDSPGSVLSNLSHYKSHFERNGWQEVYADMATEMVKNFGGASLIMQKGSDELVLSFIPDNNGRTKVVGVYVDK